MKVCGLPEGQIIPAVQALARGQSINLYIAQSQRDESQSLNDSLSH